ncbi:hypothetical protein [Pedosphaera parvula]|uniref:Uncharacterized protein n=1 Tax=Pedosphaera parvula (strain Ellin514) TaxID=320771 RepID=B9XE87_PEDPL|nr:hypothetical protein [Pedosphaera parvula]EEF61978.1 conserved hypothetical protein [Pedosphaera parvula Ellin514]
MSPTLAAEILSYAYETDKPLYRAMLGAVAEARKVRPVFLERQPRAQRHTTMLSTLTRPAMEPAAGNLIRTWLVKKQNPMLVQYLDALGIPHKEGVVDDLPPAMDDEKLKAAVEGLLSKFPHEEVAVYLLAFNEMNEANWPNLKAMLETDPRLQLGAQA